MTLFPVKLNYRFCTCNLFQLRLLGLFSKIPVHGNNTDCEIGKRKEEEEEEEEEEEKDKQTKIPQTW